MISTEGISPSTNENNILKLATQLDLKAVRNL